MPDQRRHNSPAQHDHARDDSHETDSMPRCTPVPADNCYAESSKEMLEQSPIQRERNPFEKGIAKSRKVNSSFVDASSPMAAPEIHGNAVFTESSKFSSCGAHAHTCSPPRKTRRHTDVAAAMDTPPRAEKNSFERNPRSVKARDSASALAGKRDRAVPPKATQRDRQRGKHRDKQRQRKLYRNEVP